LDLKEKSSMSKALIAVFTPKSDQADDVSLELAFKAADANIDGLNLTALELPRSWTEAFSSLESALDGSWDAVLLVTGSDIGSLAIERLALNECDAREKDSEGRRPLNKRITNGGEPGFWTGLPYRELVLGMSSKGVPSYASHNPGGGIPNFVFYKLMEWVAQRKSVIMGGLIQLPYLESLRFMNKVDPESVLPLLAQTIFEMDERDDSLAFDMERLARFKESPTL